MRLYILLMALTSNVYANTTQFDHNHGINQRNEQKLNPSQTSRKASSVTEYVKRSPVAPMPPPGNLIMAGMLTAAASQMGFRPPQPSSVALELASWIASAFEAFSPQSSSSATPEPTSAAPTFQSSQMPWLTNTATRTYESPQGPFGTYGTGIPASPTPSPDQKDRASPVYSGFAGVLEEKPKSSGTPAQMQGGWTPTPGPYFMPPAYAQCENNAWNGACAKGLVCVGDPRSRGITLDSICVPTTRKCGGLTNKICSEGMACVSDPRSECKPWNGEYGCPGVCV